LGVVAVLLVWLTMAIERAIIPTLIAISESEVARVANEAIVNAINGHIEALLEGKEFLEFETDPSGKLLYVKSKTADLNRVQAEALNVLQEMLSGLSGFNVYVPLGQTLGSRIFAPFGPKIKVSLFPYGTVRVEVKDSVEVTGINQLKYNVSLYVTCSIRVVIPLISSKTQVTSEIPLVTILLPGQVPETYISVPPGFLPGPSAYPK